MQETGMLGCKSNDMKLDEDPNGTPVDKGSYQRLLAKLIYLSHRWPAIAYVVSLVSQFMHAPRESHLETVLRYLKSAPGKVLFFMRNNNL